MDLPPARIRASNVSILAVEMMRSTAQLLKLNFKRFQVPGRIVHAAVSNKAGSVMAFAADAGREDLGLGVPGGQNARNPPPRNETVKRVTVDSLVKDVRGHIDLLSIDTEGFDRLVLRGAVKALNRTRIVEFEYHRLGAWKGASLWETVSWLQADYNFRCWWQGGGDGRLALIEAKCTQSMRRGFWSNVLCAREDRFKRLFEHLSTSVNERTSLLSL